MSIDSEGSNLSVHLLMCTAPQWSGARPRTNERAKESVNAAATAAAASAIGCTFVRSAVQSSFCRRGKCKVVSQSESVFWRGNTKEPSSAPQEKRGQLGAVLTALEETTTAAVAGSSLVRHKKLHIIL